MSTDQGERPAVVERLPRAYWQLFDRVRAVCAADPRIRGLWLSGSLARGVADAGSDLDTVIAVRDEDFAAYAENWRDFLATITPTVIAGQIPNSPGSFYSMTPECLRLDVVAEPVSAVPESPHRHRVVVFAEDGLDTGAEAPTEPTAPDPARMRGLVEEYFRQLGLFGPAVIGRRDWLLGVVGVQGARQLLYDVFVQANQPLPPMGVKQWSSKLTADQRALLESLPPLDSTPESLIPAMRATAEAYATAGRAALDANGVAWPTELADATRASFEREAAAYAEGSG